MSELSIFNLKEKVALITGGATGIGRACATALATAGAKVAILDVNEHAGHAAADSLRRLSSDAFFERCDITKEHEISKALETVVARFGRLDIAVNSAGTIAPSNDSEQSLADWSRVIDVNLTGVWLCIRAQAHQMSRQSPIGGKIINIASMWSELAGANGSYCASKAGVVHMTKSLAVQWGGHNINVNCISPGWVMTPLFKRSVNSIDDFRRRAREMIPLGHVQRPEDLWGPVIFLASAASDYVTGLNLVADGGHTLNSWYFPMTRTTPPRIDPEQEMAHLQEDLKLLG